MEKMPDKERRIVAHELMLNQLLGRHCAVCGFKYETEQDLKEHGILGGYNSDVVGKKCWQKYIDSHSETSQ
jgi:rubredoxin